MVVVFKLGDEIKIRKLKNSYKNSFIANKIAQTHKLTTAPIRTAE